MKWGSVQTAFLDLKQIPVATLLLLKHKCAQSPTPRMLLCALYGCQRSWHHRWWGKLYCSVNLRDCLTALQRFGLQNDQGKTYGQRMAAVSNQSGITPDIWVVLKGKLSLSLFYFAALRFFGLEPVHMEDFITILKFQLYIFLLHTAHWFLKGELY